MMKCKYCGGNLTLEQAYCPHCGRPNEEAAQHVKDMEHYKSNFEDTKSDVYEVAEKNTEIMSHMIIITVLVILCVVVFVVSARSWSIHRGLLQFDAGIRQSSYMKQMEQYLEDDLQKQRLELHEKIFTNLMEKNERWYDAIVLVYYMEMPQAKAAELMGIRLEVLHSLLHRAKKWIKKKYGTEYEEMNRED